MSASAGNLSQSNQMTNLSHGQMVRMSMTPQGQTMNHMSVTPQGQVGHRQRMPATPQSQMMVNNVGASQGKRGRGRGQGQIRAPQQQLFQQNQLNAQNQQHKQYSMSTANQVQMVQSTAVNTAMVATPQGAYMR